jgi:biopolymer transport protein ExbD/DNA-directed RNA polymerase subunit RPC12/RpoP
MIEFRCINCGKKLGASDRSAGKLKTCPKCGSRVPVPQPGTPLAPAPLAATPTESAGEHPLLLLPKRAEHKDLIDMTAMVDIVFFLLIFFLVTSLQSLEAVIELPAPQAPASAPDSVQAVPDYVNDDNYVVVTIDADDAIWVEDQEALSEQDLRSKLRAARQKDERNGMLINGSPEATHGTFVMVLDAGADAGMSELLFSVPQSDESPAGG